MSRASDLLTRVERLKARRALYDAQLQECADYIRPIRSHITTQQSEGSIDRATVYDSTALDANRKLGARLSSTLCSPAITWFDLAVHDKQIQELPEVQRWFTDARDEMLMAAAQSLFYAEVNEAFIDAPGLGTGGIFVDESHANGQRGFRGLTVKSIGVGEVAIDEGPDGLVDVVAREFRLSARAALSRWPTGLSAKTIECAEQKPEELVDFVHLVEPRQSAGHPAFGNDGQVLPVPAKRLPWASYYLERTAKHLVDEGGYHEMPYAILRWSRPAGWLYGYGIGHDALPDIKALNKSREIFERSWAIAAQPPVKKRRNIQTKVRLVPGGVTEVMHPDDITEFRTEARFDVAQAGINDLRAGLRAMWFDDRLQLKDSPQMTAAEVYARMELMLQLLGPNGVRCMFEFLNRIIERIFNLMARARCFPPPPQALWEHIRQEGRWHVRYQSPLSRAQRAPELHAIERTISAAGAMAGAFPEVTDVLNADEALRHVSEVAGVPPQLIRSQDEVAEIRKARAQQRAEAEALAQTNSLAESAGKVAPFIKAVTPQAEAA